MQINKLGDHGPYSVALKYADGQTYTFEFEKLGAEKATDLLLDILSVVGDGLGALTSLLTGNRDALDLDLGSAPMENVVRKLTSGMTRDRALTKRLLRSLSSDRVICNGAPVNYDQFYADKLPLSFMAVRANLEVQFGNFFAAAAGVLAPQGQSPAAPQSPNPS